MYTPVTVTRYNLEWAIRENMRLIREELAHKITEANAVNMQDDLDMGGANIKNVAPAVDDGDLVSKALLDYYKSL